MEDLIEIEVSNEDEIKWEGHSNNIPDHEVLFVRKIFEYKRTLEKGLSDPKSKEILDEFTTANNIKDYSFERMIDPHRYEKIYKFTALFHNENIHIIKWRDKNGSY